MLGKHGDFGQYKDENPVDYKPSFGSDVTNCIAECVSFAKKLRHTVIIRSFNGVDITINQDTTPEQAYAAWQAQTDANAAAYRNSPEGKKAEQERIERAQYAQREVDRLLDLVMPFDRLPTKSPTDTLVAWLTEFADHADHIDVNYDKNALADKLESFGYKNNAHVIPQDFDEQYRREAVAAWTREMKGEYIIGQAISCLRHGMGPHPGLTQKFSEEYFSQAA